MLPGWEVCADVVDLEPMTATPLPPEEGESYLGLTIGAVPFSPQSLLPASVSTPLCAPLSPGIEYAYSIYLTMSTSAPPTTFSTALKVWGGSSPCAMDELLWTSGGITSLDTWTPFCMAFSPTQAHRYLTLGLATDAGDTFAPNQWSYILVDDLAPDANCRRRDP
jgi:hypothetical protein